MNQMKISLVLFVLVAFSLGCSQPSAANPYPGGVAQVAAQLGGPPVEDCPKVDPKKPKSPKKKPAPKDPDPIEDPPPRRRRPPPPPPPPPPPVFKEGVAAP